MNATSIKTKLSKFEIDTGQYICYFTRCPGPAHSVASRTSGKKCKKYSHF